MEFSERVLVLQVGGFREADLWVRFLSPTRGLLSAFAFGGSRSRRRFVGCLDIFNEISVRVRSSGRGAYLALQEGVLVNGVTRLREDWQRFGMAINCIRFLQLFGVGPEGAGTAHHLMHNTLQLLEKSETVPRLLPFFFRTRLAFDQGYSLRMNACAACGRPMNREQGVFLLREGAIHCRACTASRDERRMHISPETLEGLEAVRTLPPEEWKGMALSAGASREFARVMDAFIQYHVGIAWENGRFVRR